MKKNIIYSLLLLLLIGCYKEKTIIPQLDDLISGYRNDNPLVMELSEDSVQLDYLNRRSQALLITWESLTELEKSFDSVRYLFEMDLAGDNFSTSSQIMTEEIAQDVNYKTFTGDDLDNLLRSYGISGSGYTGVEMRVIAQIVSDEQYIKPLYSTKTVFIKGFDYAPTPLFLYGNAASVGGSTDDLFALNEVKAGELYTWRGKLYPGDFIITKHKQEKYPAYGDGGNGNLEVLNSEDGDKFKIDEEGNYAIVIDLRREVISITSVLYKTVYYRGSATATGWSSVAMEWDIFKPYIWTATVALSSNSFKFSLTNPYSSGDWEIKPKIPDASIVEDTNVVASPWPDFKWKIKADESGNYKIVLDIKSMKVKFIKLN